MNLLLVAVVTAPSWHKSAHFDSLHSAILTHDCRVFIICPISLAILASNFPEGYPSSQCVIIRVAEASSYSSVQKVNHTVEIGIDIYLMPMKRVDVKTLLLCEK